MAQCSRCKQKIETQFLGKILGTFVRDGKGKRMPVCSACQKREDTEKRVEPQ